MGRRQVQKNGKMWEFFGWITKVCGWYVCEGVALLLATVTLVLHVCSWNSLVHCIFGPMPLCSDTSLVHCIFGPMHCNAKFWCPNYKGYSIKLQMGSRELWALNPTTFPRSHCFTEMTTLGWKIFWCRVRNANVLRLARWESGGHHQSFIACLL